MYVLRIVFILTAWIGVSTVEFSLQANRVLVVKFKIVHNPLEVWCPNKEFSLRCKNAIALIKESVNFTVPDMLNTVLGDDRIKHPVMKRKGTYVNLYVYAVQPSNIDIHTVVADVITCTEIKTCGPSHSNLSPDRQDPERNAVMKVMMR